MVRLSVGVGFAVLSVRSCRLVVQDVGGRGGGGVRV